MPTGNSGTWLAIGALSVAVACVQSQKKGIGSATRVGETLEPGIALATFDSVWTVVKRTYVDTAFVAMRWNAVRDTLRPQAKSMTRRDDLERLLASTLSRIPDSHFYIIPARVASEVGRDSTNGGGGTTGISVRVVGNRALVWRVEPGSAGALAGVAPGQSVDRVEGRVVRSSIARVLSLPDASRQRALAELDHKMNGQLSPGVGDTVRVRLIKPGKRSAFDLLLVALPVRGTISKFGNLPPIAGVVRVARETVTMPGTGASACVGAISFNIWLPALAPELRHAVDSVADCAGIVIDLRGNPGGVGAMVMGFAGYFVETPVSLGTMRMRDLKLSFAINPRRVRIKGVEDGPFMGPVAILVDAMTASTSEIFATGMQRLGRARVFGQRSSGAALPALMQGLPSGDVFVHAIADFTDPSGNRIEGAGVVPDEIIPLTERDLSHNIDAPLNAAIEWIAATARSRSQLRP